MQPPLTDAFSQWTFVLGIGMPLVVAAVVQSNWPKWLKAIVAAAACIVASVIQLSLEGKLDMTNWGLNAIGVMALAFVFFRDFWKPLGIAGTLEKATDLKKEGS